MKAKLLTGAIAAAGLMAISATAHHSAAMAIRRRRRELPLIFIAPANRIVRFAKAIAQAAHGPDQIGPGFAPQTSDEDFYGIGILVEILIIEMLHQLRAGDDLALMMHHV